MLPANSPAPHYEPPSLTEKQREQQRELIVNLFDCWQLTNSQRAILLGLSPKTATSVHRYKTGKAFIPQYRDIQDRIGHLLAIHRYLNRAYPYNKELAYRWVTTTNSDFENYAPIEIAYREGFIGLVKIRNYLASVQEH